MSRLIDADAMRDSWIDGVNEPIYCANDVINNIDEQPTVDAVEVVRCKDCVIRNSQIGNDMYGFCGKAEDFVGDDDYCSAGKRKDGAE